MFETLLQNYIEDLTVQGVALCLQVNSFAEGQAKNPILRNIRLEAIDSTEITQRFRIEFNMVRRVQTIEELVELTERWFEEKIYIQYVEEFGYGEEGKKFMARAYCCIFFLRILKKYHKELWKMCQN